MTPELPIEHVNFLEAGLVSDLASAGQGRGRWVECGLIGRDGVVAMPAVLGLDRGAHLSTVQIGGAGLRLSVAELWRAMDRSASLRRVLLCYAHVFMTQTAQSAACNARHTIVERLARCLLMAHDRIDDERIPLTHEFLSLMLGTRRMGVTEALHILESGGSIRSKRARVRGYLWSIGRSSRGRPAAATIS
jgi:CRP-like cAMP-binding protein